MKFTRLYQPRNPWFWLLVLLNVLSSGISWILQKQALPLAITLMLSGFVLANIAFGLKIALQLIKEPAAGAGARQQGPVS